MTQAEQERDLDEARIYLGCTNLTSDRCRHESVTETSIWVFAQDLGFKPARHVQIASVHRDCETTSDYVWEVTRMAYGQPVARRREKTLLAAISWVVQYDWDRSADLIRRRAY